MFTVSGDDFDMGVDIKKEKEFEFEGVGFAFTGGTQKKGEEDYTFEVEMYVDDKLVETTYLPTNYHDRKPTPFWHYQLARGKHKVKLKVLNPTDKATLSLDNMIIYDNKPIKPQY